MMFKLRASIVTMLVLAVGLFVYSPAFAGHGKATGADWHSDVMTINETGSLGTFGPEFVPAWVKTDCDAPVAPGFNATTATDTGCHGFAEEVLSAWLTGGWWDPRGGTEFIPPSGDHHRSGWRTMMQAHFSAGQWLSGFGAIASTFPFYPAVGTAGPGEAPVGVYELCADPDGMGTGTANAINAEVLNTTTYPMEGVNNTSGVNPALDTAIAACRARARAAGTLLMELVDHHGEPLTPGRFPRYIPHERLAWVSTLVTKYTASPSINIDTADVDTASDSGGARVSQVFRSQHNFVTSGTVTWFSMSNENAAGCAGGWCQWVWNAATATLYKIESANPGSPATVAAISIAANEVTSISVIDDYTDATVVKQLSDIEKAPSEIYQSIGQWVQLGALPTGIDNGENQAFWSDFWVLSGPNFQSEEGTNPYTWMLCGVAGSPADENCTTPGGAIDAPNGRQMAITQFGLDPINRYGADLRPDSSADQGCVDANGNGICNEPGVGPGGDADCTGAPAGCTQGLRTGIVQCVAGGDADNSPLTSDCESLEGLTNGYGNDATGERLYFREAVENKQRGFVRENRSFAFSFANASNGAGGGTPGFFGGDLTGTIRQAVAQNINDTGFLLSCLNCEPLPNHMVNNHVVPNYTFNWDLTGGVGFVEHADIISGATGTIP